MSFGKITDNFSWGEFHCKDGTHVPDSLMPNVVEIAQNLQVLRDYLGCPIHINSAYRTPYYNRRIGGVDNSFHIKAMAVDIVSRNHSPTQLKSIINGLINQGKMKQGGLSAYASFVHYDIRGYKARW
jgi:uncharacterized protein YcbK (DUF882 family)